MASLIDLFRMDSSIVIEKLFSAIFAPQRIFNPPKKGRIFDWQKIDMKEYYLLNFCKNYYY